MAGRPMFGRSATGTSSTPYSRPRRFRNAGRSWLCRLDSAAQRFELDDFASPNAFRERCPVVAKDEQRGCEADRDHREQQQRDAPEERARQQAHLLSPSGTKT
jgi:hypothetical protein